MLNKLLKRCMPWMDKGRWYHVEFDLNSDGQIAHIKYDNIFDSYEITTGVIPSVKLHVVNNRQNIVLKDFKAMITRSEEKFYTDVNNVGWHPDIQYDENNNVTDIYMIFGIDYIDSGHYAKRSEFWLYITEDH